MPHESVRGSWARRLDERGPYRRVRVQRRNVVGDVAGEGGGAGDAIELAAAAVDVVLEVKAVAAVGCGVGDGAAGERAAVRQEPARARGTG